MVKNNSYKVKISIGDAVIEVEGEVVGVTKIIDSLKSVLQKKPSNITETVYTPKDDGNKAYAAPAFDVDIRAFFNEKKPHNQLEAVSVVAFYLQYIEKENKKDAIDVNTMKDEFRKADYPLPKVPTQVLIDAKKAGYFDGFGTGQYKLNSVGYNLVKFALGKEAEENFKKVAKRKKSKKKRNKK